MVKIQLFYLRKESLSKLWDAYFNKISYLILNHWDLSKQFYFKIAFNPRFIRILLNTNYFTF